MEIVKTKRKIKCSFTPHCCNVAEQKILTNKYSLGICSQCLKTLYHKLSQQVVPPAVVTKFNLKR